jgi:hypothetical protein
MKRLIGVGLAAVMVLSLAGTALAAPKGINFNGTHYNLNLVGKSKTMPGDYDNPDRHTMFIPQDTSDFSIDLEEPNNLDQATLPGIKINMTQGSEFAVIDGNATDGVGSFQLGPGKYAVYIAVKATNKKLPGGTSIAGWVQAYDDVGDLWYYINVGNVSVSKGKTWTDATGLFFVNTTEDTLDFLTGSEPGYVDNLGMWVFDYMAGLDTWAPVDADGNLIYDLSEFAYFWQLTNNGDKLIQVRFYPM